MQKTYIGNFDNTAKLLEELPLRIEHKILQRATLAGARVIAASVRKNAPVGEDPRSPSSKKYKPLRRNIRVSAIKNVRKSKGIRGARVHTNNAFWANFLELETKNMAAQPFFRNAVASSREEALKRFRERLSTGIDSETKLLIKRYGTL